MTERKVAVVLGVEPGLGATAARRFAPEGFAVGRKLRQEMSEEAKKVLFGHRARQ